MFAELSFRKRTQYERLHVKNCHEHSAVDLFKISKETDKNCTRDKSHRNCLHKNKY